ncbi:hypothetical protein Cadr_000024298 [Camelus dromedarius]|uniref:Uncharacterized protein n=1 Tax=Camelus dromedarius TaxID=9838 RepID=A0A5N4CP39_CAMDR|nr:hypothetical protein Cadr_000024298 [Camelus dromedarius]
MQCFSLGEEAWPGGLDSGPIGSGSVRCPSTQGADLVACCTLLRQLGELVGGHADWTLLSLQMACEQIFRPADHLRERVSPLNSKARPHTVLRPHPMHAICACSKGGGRDIGARPFPVVSGSCALVRVCATHRLAELLVHAPNPVSWVDPTLLLLAVYVWWVRRGGGLGGLPVCIAKGTHSMSARTCPSPPGPIRIAWHLHFCRVGAVQLPSGNNNWKAGPPSPRTRGVFPATGKQSFILPFPITEDTAASGPSPKSSWLRKASRAHSLTSRSGFLSQDGCAQSRCLKSRPKGHGVLPGAEPNWSCKEFALIRQVQEGCLGFVSRTMPLSLLGKEGHGEARGWGCACQVTVSSDDGRRWSHPTYDWRRSHEVLTTTARASRARADYSLSKHFQEGTLAFLALCLCLPEVDNEETDYTARPLWS